MSESYATVNPCSMCMPMGSVLAFKGIEGCMPIFHGSQGCSTYMRLYLAHHFREPVDIASSALSEKGAVYGGAANLKMGLKNVIQGYSPKVIGVATTCLAETIGDDVDQIIREFQAEEQIAKEVPIISVHTPSYSGSHEEGYYRALIATVRALARRNEPNGKVNLVLGSVISPAEVRYIKDLLDCWGCGYLLLPDTSDTFDSPLCEDLPRIPKGGTPLDDIRDMANSVATVTLGGRVDKSSAGAYLEKEFNVRHTVLPLPIGVEYTDLMVAKLEEYTGSKLPGKYENERGRLLDVMVDVHKQLAKVKAAIYGDTEMVLGIAKLMAELGMDPRILATGAKNHEFAERAAEIAPRSSALCGVDYDDIHKEMISNDVDLMIGPSTGRQISKEEKIPLLRVGLPNHDRFGAARQMFLGYAGAMSLVDDMANLLLDRR
jgi:nitrogenase molybdenum-iron protein NifN